MARCPRGCQPHTVTQAVGLVAFALHLLGDLICVEAYIWAYRVFSTLNLRRDACSRHSSQLPAVAHTSSDAAFPRLEERSGNIIQGFGYLALCGLDLKTTTGRSTRRKLPSPKSPQFCGVAESKTKMGKRRFKVQKNGIVSTGTQMKRRHRAIKAARAPEDEPNSLSPQIEEIPRPVADETTVSSPIVDSDGLSRPGTSHYAFLVPLKTAV